MPLWLPGMLHWHSNPSAMLPFYGQSWLTHFISLQVCQFCFHNIKSNMNGLCPACRRPYDEKTIQYKVVTAEELVFTC